MSDRELLESAAKAAGQERSAAGDLWSNARGMLWNPLTDDGDALRLAVALQMDIFVRAEWVEVVAPMGAPQKVHYEHGVREKATRLAIVRAAAAVWEKP